MLCKSFIISAAPCCLKNKAGEREKQGNPQTDHFTPQSPTLSQSFSLFRLIYTSWKSFCSTADSKSEHQRSISQQPGDKDGETLRPYTIAQFCEMLSEKKQHNLTNSSCNCGKCYTLFFSSLTHKTL